MGIMETWKSPEHSFFYDSNIESRLKPNQKLEMLEMLEMFTQVCKC